MSEQPHGTVRLYNTGGRTWTHDERRKGGEKYELKPKLFAEVPERVAKVWMTLGADEVILAAAAQNTQEGLRTQLATAQTRVIELEKQVANLEGELAKARAGSSPSKRK